MNKIYLWKIENKIIYHTCLQVAAALDGITREPDKTVSSSEWDDAEGLVRIINGDIVLGKTDEEITVENELSEMDQEETSLQNELDEKDYKVIQVAERGFSLAEINPELHERRETCRSRINCIRERKRELLDILYQS